jgi:hypothetical protein
MSILRVYPLSRAMSKALASSGFLLVQGFNTSMDETFCSTILNTRLLGHGSIV